jgi:hypothetical protein
MKVRFSQAPARETLRETRVQELVRDYPELLTPLLEMGIDPWAHGSKTLPQVLGGGGEWLPALEEVLRWRGGGGTEGRSI